VHRVVLAILRIVLGADGFLLVGKDSCISSLRKGVEFVVLKPGQFGGLLDGLTESTFCGKTQMDICGVGG
jgi:hypothetical protein